MLWRGTWQEAGVEAGATESSHLKVLTQSRASHLRMTCDFVTLKSVSSDILYPSSKATPPKATQMAPPTGDHVFRHPSL